MPIRFSFIIVLSIIGIPNGRLCTGLLVLVRSQLDSSQHSREQRQQPQRHCRWAPQLPPSLLGLPSFPLAVSFPRIFGILFVLSTHCRIARACACSSFHISVLRRINTALHSSAETSEPKWLLGSRQWRYCDYESVCIVYCLP